MSTFESPFELGDKVTLDGCDSIIATVTGVAFYGHGPYIQVSWIANWTLSEHWVSVYRLTMKRKVGT